MPFFFFEKLMWISWTLFGLSGNLGQGNETCLVVFHWLQELLGGYLLLDKNVYNDGALIYILLYYVAKIYDFLDFLGLAGAEGRKMKLFPYIRGYWLLWLSIDMNNSFFSNLLSLYHTIPKCKAKSIIHFGIFQKIGVPSSQNRVLHLQSSYKVH